MFVKSRGEPALTSSPSLTASLKRTPLKSEGLIAAVEMVCGAPNSGEHSPTRSIFTPRLIVTTFDMYVLLMVSLNAQSRD